jgi:hypothetical protein
VNGIELNFLLDTSVAETILLVWKKKKNSDFLNTGENNFKRAG